MQDIAALVGLVFENMIALVVVGVGMQLAICYAIQTIADKEGVAHSWMAWVPLLQLYPMIAVAGSFTGFLGTMAFGILAVVASALLPPVGIVLALGWGLWLLFFFVRLFWNMAESRGVAGWIGLLAFVPLLNFAAYLYIAFHDGLVPPHKVGLLLGFVCIVLPAVPQVRSARELATLGSQLPAMAAAAESDDQRGMLRLMRQWFETVEGMEGVEGMDASDEDRAALSKAFGELTAALDGEREGADDDESKSGSLIPSASHGPSAGEKANLRAVSDAFECPTGTHERGARPPQGYRRWCEGTDPVRGAVRHGGYASWHRNGQLRRVGIFEDGKRQGVWTRWSAKGIKQAQAEYEDGLQHGFQFTWDETGRTYHQVRFDRGEPVAG